MTNYNYNMAIKNKILNRVIPCSTTIIQALKKMDEVGVKMLFVFNEEKFESILTIGDIQRAIIKGVDTNKSVNNILNKSNFKSDNLYKP